MAQVGKIIGGAALIAGAVALDAATFGTNIAAMPEEFAAFLSIIGSTGASLIASGTAGLLASPPPGQGVTSQNPIKAWDICYGQVKTGGTFVDIESNGGILSNGSNTYDKCTNFVVMLAGHPIKSVDQVRLNGKAVELGPGGSGAQSTTWTFSPASNQNQTNISSISRSGGVVTIKLVAGLSGQNGLQLNIQNVADHTFNGVFTVTQPNPVDDTTFTYLCGGADGSSSGGYVLTTYADYKNRCHFDLTSCLGNHTSTFPEFLSTSNLWTPAHKNLGKASIYAAFYYDQTVFANGLPQMSFVLSGKNDIYDPRLGDISNSAAHVYTNNAALVIADYLTNKTWGYGLNYGTDIPLAQLIAAANVCDEQVPLAAGGTEPRYTINMKFDLSRGHGEVLQDMLAACAGRTTIQSGQYVTVPGAWVGPSISLTQDNLIGPVEYKPIMTISGVCNGVKGTYTSPVTNWQSGDIPPYAEDTLHKYASDRWLEADGGVRLWRDVLFPATTSAATAQRLAKIELERTRREGRLTLHCDMSAYPAVALDVIEFTYERYGWNSKTWEVLSSKLVVQSDPNGGAPRLGVDLELAETDSTVYDWSTTEELTPADTPSPAIANGNILAGPQFLELESGPATTVVGEDGVAIPRILAAWLAAPDATIQSGGTIQVEYQKVGDVLWTPCGSISGTQTQFYISGVVSGSQYNVQIQGYTAKGVSSGWVQAGPVTVSATATSFSASNLTYPDGTPVSALQPAQAGADMTAAQALAHTGASGQMVPNGNFLLGNIDEWGTVVGTSAAATYFPAVKGISLGPNSGCQSGTFSVIPGQTYRVSFTGAANSFGTNSVYHRIFYAATYSPNTQTSLDTPLHDFLVGASIPNTVATYSYPWTCPAGMYFASVAMYQTGDVFLYYTNVSVETYGVAVEEGADKTGNNTANNTTAVGTLPAGTITSTINPGGGIDFNNPGNTNQGDLSKINQADTVNIVAGAVNAQITYSSTSQITAAASSTTMLATSTLTTNGGYCKIRCMMEVVGLALSAGTGHYPYPSVNIWKGAAGSTSLMFYGNLFVPPGLLDGGLSCIAIEAVDNAPDLAQQYTVTMTCGAYAVNCDGITLVVENAKV